MDSMILVNVRNGAAGGMEGGEGEGQIMAE